MGATGVQLRGLAGRAASELRPLDRRKKRPEIDVAEQAIIDYYIAFRPSRPVLLLFLLLLLLMLILTGGDQ